AGQGGHVSGQAGESGEVGPRRRVGPAPVELEVSEQGLDVGQVLGGGAAGAHRQSHRLHGPVEVAVQLAEIGDARVGGEGGLAVDERLQRAVGVAVAAQLDVRVHQDRVRVGGQRGGAVGGQPVAQP